MPDCLKWALLIVSCMVGRVTGLHEPLNIQIESRDFSLFLTWLPAPENPSNVTYEVQYTNFDADDDEVPYRWTPVPACENISVTECDFTCALMKHWDWNHTVRVRTVSPRSSWITIDNIQYTFTVNPSPPNVNVTQGNGSITIDVFTKKPQCAPQSIFLISLKYFVVIKGKYNPEEVILEEELHGPSITKKSLGYNGEYCVAVKTRYETSTTKESEFSHPVCLILTQKDGHDGILVAVLLLSLIFILGVIIVAIWYRTTAKSKMPKALDFSGNTYHQKAPSMPEVYSDIIQPLTISSLAEQDSSTKFLLFNKHDAGLNVYPITGRGYMERPTMQTLALHSKESFSSKSSSDCTGPSTSGSATDLLIKAKNKQIDDCFKEINVNVSGDVQMFSSTTISVSNPFDSLSIVKPNSFVSVPFDTLRIGGNDDHMDYSDEDSSDQSSTDSENSLDLLSIDYKMSASKCSSQDEKTHKDWCSGYTQRTFPVT